MGSTKVIVRLPSSSALLSSMIRATLLFFEDSCSTDPHPIVHPVCSTDTDPAHKALLQLLDGLGWIKIRPRHLPESDLRLLLQSTGAGEPRDVIQEPISCLQPSCTDTRLAC
jgi:hypothetical protein